jgi:hypothetical protein
MPGRAAGRNSQQPPRQAADGRVQERNGAAAARGAAQAPGDGLFPQDEGRMNTLVMLLVTTIPGADTPPAIQTQPAPIVSSYSGDAGRFGWFRNRPGLRARLRGWFGRSPTETMPASTGSPSPSSTIAPPLANDGRLVPVPVSSAAPVSRFSGTIQTSSSGPVLGGPVK